MSRSCVWCSRLSGGSLDSRHALGPAANLKRRDDVHYADGDQPAAGDQGQDGDRVERRDDQHGAADHDDQPGQHLPAAAGQVVERQRRREQGESAKQPANSDPYGQQGDRLEFVAEAKRPRTSDTMPVMNVNTRIAAPVCVPNAANTYPIPETTR